MTFHARSRVIRGAIAAAMVGLLGLLLAHSLSPTTNETAQSGPDRMAAGAGAGSQLAPVKIAVPPGAARVLAAQAEGGRRSGGNESTFAEPLATRSPPDAPIAVGDTPFAPDAVVDTVALQLAEPFVSKLERNRAAGREVTLVVLEVNAARMVPMGRPAPILYVGEHVAEPVNYGHRSGRLVAIVPGTVDLRSDLIWFGEPGVPYEVTSKLQARQRELATRSGIRATGRETVARLARSANAPPALQSSSEVYSKAAALVLRYAPEEREFVAHLLLSAGNEAR